MKISESSDYFLSLRPKHAPHVPAPNINVYSSPNVSGIDAFLHYRVALSCKRNVSPNLPKIFL